MFPVYPILSNTFKTIAKGYVRKLMLSTQGLSNAEARPASRLTSSFNDGAASSMKDTQSGHPGLDYFLWVVRFCLEACPRNPPDVGTDYTLNNNDIKSSTTSRHRSCRSSLLSHLLSMDLIKIFFQPTPNPQTSGKQPLWLHIQGKQRSWEWQTPQGFSFFELMSLIDTFFFNRLQNVYIYCLAPSVSPMLISTKSNDLSQFAWFNGERCSRLCFTYASRNICWQNQPMKSLWTDSVQRVKIPATILIMSRCIKKNKQRNLMESILFSSFLFIHHSQKCCISSRISKALQTKAFLKLYLRYFISVYLPRTACHGAFALCQPIGQEVVERIFLFTCLF